MTEPTQDTQCNGKRSSSGRREVSFECEVACDQWDGSVYLEAKDLSLRGIWVETPLPIEAGENVQVSLMPPGWPRPMPLVASAVVARVELSRRRNDPRGPGMDLAFTHLGTEQRHLLEEVMRRLPIKVTSTRPYPSLDERVPM